MTYKTKGVCSVQIDFEIEATPEGNRVHHVKYTGGCNGNTQGVALLAEGMLVNDVIARLKGVRCGSRPTSCPDQLAQALEEYAN